MEQASYATHGKYNAMVFNMSQPYSQNICGVKVLAQAPAYAAPGAAFFRELGDNLARLGMEKRTRARFTQEYVKKAVEKFPNYNVVISHNGGQVRGNNVRHEHYELDIAFGHTIGYEIYFSPKGQPFTFVRKGDGSHINWAFEGEFKRVNDNTITATVH